MRLIVAFATITFFMTAGCSNSTKKGDLPKSSFADANIELSQSALVIVDDMEDIPIPKKAIELNPGVVTRRNFESIAVDT